jgi:hypothetical protein
MTDFQSVARSQAKWWELFYAQLSPVTLDGNEREDELLELAVRYEEEGLRPETAAMAVEREMRDGGY